MIKLILEEYDEEDYDYYYYVASYYGEGYRGLEDDLYTNSDDEVESWIWDKLQKGSFVTLTTPKYRFYYNPDKVEYGEDAYGIEDYLEGKD